ASDKIVKVSEAMSDAGGTASKKKDSKFNLESFPMAPQETVPMPAPAPKIAVSAPSEQCEGKITPSASDGATANKSSDDQIKEEDASKSPSGFAAETSKPSAPDISLQKEPSKTTVKNWGNWLEGETPASWNVLLPENMINKKTAKINVLSSSARPTSINLPDPVKLSEVLKENYCTVEVNYGKNNAITSFIVNNPESNKSIKKEITRLDTLKNEDMDTYLYVKAMTLKKSSYYIAALSALNEIEKNNPDIKMAHIIKLKVAIYHDMGENELARSEAEKIKK
ncbi:MAG TPA: hypothetical protein PKK26_06565, partial [Candidatus Wallbacteria bacterium]|nr:hypothetical protein [Candidatus Wallbacteria bacterium]